MFLFFGQFFPFLARPKPMFFQLFSYFGPSGPKTPFLAGGQGADTLFLALDSRAQNHGH